jgi:cytochrome c oxidase subunit 1
MSAHAATTHDGTEVNYLNWNRGLWSWLSSTDHKRIGLMYLAAITVFFLLGGLAAMLMRTELAFPNLVKEDAVFAAETYNVLFTLHGVFMIFLFVVPGIPATLGNFLIPLMIGAKDVAFPRLNLFSFYLYVIGAGFGAISMLNPIDTGWTFYAPYSTTTGTSVSWMLMAAFILGFSSILTGLNFIVTIHQLRAPGMTWMRLPVFIWASYATAIIQTVATPVVGMTLLLVIAERWFNIGIFDPTKGGDPVLMEHLFWFYSHPVVYIMVLPAFGVVGEIFPVFSRKPLFGYKMVVISSMAIAAVGFIVWAHHMFVAGISEFSAKLFSIITFAVAIPTAVKVFNWVSTMYKGSISFSVPMLYAMAFVFLFMIAGTTGIYLAMLGVDVYYHDTYFVVAHFHYTIQGGAVIGLIAALHFWFPKISGKMYNENFARFTFACIFIGFNLTFIPQFILGFDGMPRRYYDYPPQYATLHLVSTIGAYLNGFGYFTSLAFLLYTHLFGKVKAPRNPYNSVSLEWQTQSPPVHENFDETPVVTTDPYNYGKHVGSHA